MGKRHLLRRIGKGLARHGQALHPLGHLAQLAAVGPGIHVNAAAHRAGNAPRKGQAGQAPFCRRQGHGGEQRPSPCPKDAALRLHAVHHAAQADHQPADAPVQHQQVAAPAHQGHGHAHVCGGIEGGAQLRLISRFSHQIGRAAQAQGGIVCHGCVTGQPHGRSPLRKAALQGGHVLNIKHGTNLLMGLLYSILPASSSKNPPKRGESVSEIVPVFPVGFHQKRSAGRWIPALRRAYAHQHYSTVATACVAGSMSPISAGAGTGCSVRRSAAFSSFRRLILPCTRMPVSARER